MVSMAVHDELSFVEWLREQQPRVHRGVALGIGDDMAVVEHRGDLLAVTSDMLLEGVHFDSATQPFRAIGHKAMACSLSDCAAMAVKPIGATVSLAIPHTTTWLDVQAMYTGMWDIANDYNLAIVGGDTTRWQHPLVIDVAMFAQPFDGIDPVTRYGARVGDGLFVTGPLGGSLLGRHLTFGPRVVEAKMLAVSLGSSLHALMDISDGLSLDVHRLCQASRVGARLDEAMLQDAVHSDAIKASKRDSRSPLEHALHDGEDFELLLATSTDIKIDGVTLLQIGHITESGLEIRTLDGSIEPLEPKGFVHG